VTAAVGCPAQPAASADAASTGRRQQPAALLQNLLSAGANVVADFACPAPAAAAAAAAAAPCAAALAAAALCWAVLSEVGAQL